MNKPVVRWFEVTGKDRPALQQFYSGLFEWEITDAGAGYGLVAAGEKGIAGGIGASSDGGDGGVTFCVEVNEPAAFLQKAQKLGGKTIVPPTEFPSFGLTSAFFADPEGDVVGLSKSAVQ
jgi:uncharacterized protein